MQLVRIGVIDNPELWEHFKAAREEVAAEDIHMRNWQHTPYLLHLQQLVEEQHGSADAAAAAGNSLLLWHCTKDGHHNSIAGGGFQIKFLGSTMNNTGYYGAGHYFTSDPVYAFQYTWKFGGRKSKNKKADYVLLLCKVVVGKPYTKKWNPHKRRSAGPDGDMGCPRELGFTTHYAVTTNCDPAKSMEEMDGDEIVCFQDHHIYPQFIVEFNADWTDPCEVQALTRQLSGDLERIEREKGAAAGKLYE